MDYSTDELFKQAKEIIVREEAVFMGEVISFIGCARATFYKYIQDKSEEMQELDRLLTLNKVAVKQELRKKWRESDNATLQLALYRLCSDEEEHRKLNQQYTDITSKGEGVDNLFEVKIINSRDELSNELHTE